MKPKSEIPIAEQVRLDAEGDAHESDEVLFMGIPEGNAVLRRDYAEWRRKAVAKGFQGDFKDACVRMHHGTPATPAQWVEAAENVYWDAYAASEGVGTYDCGFSAPWEP